MENENGNSGRRSVQTTERRARRLAVISTPTFLPDGFVQRLFSDSDKWGIIYAYLNNVHFLVPFLALNVDAHFAYNLLRDQLASLYPSVNILD